MKRVLASAVAILPALAAAHGGEAHEAPSAFAGWTLDPWATVPVVLTAALFAIGHARLRARGRAGTLRPRQVAAFWAGLGAIALAVSSPYEAVAERLFSAHMGQHELLMLVGAPLLVLARPLPAFLFALPERARGRAVAAARTRGVSRVWAFLTAPLVAFTIHAAARWLWHVPGLFEAALAHRGVHAVQHLTFVLSATLFWWAVIHGRYGRAGYGVAVLQVFLTVAHTGLLGAMVALSKAPWYATHAARTAALGDDALRDQQLAGLVMWVPAGLLLTIIGLALFAAWLGEAERRARRSG